METKLLVRGYDRAYLEDFVTDFYTSGKKYMKVDSKMYAKPSACSWTLKQALVNYVLDDYCGVCIRNGEVYLYNKEHEAEFNANVKSAHMGRPFASPVTIIKPAAAPKIEVEVKETAKPNSVILSNLLKLWKIGMEIDGISVKNLGGKYYSIIEDNLKKFTNKIELQNFTDYAQFACDNKDLLYVIQHIANKL